MKVQKTQKLLRPDAKGRLCLGNLAKGVSGFKVTIDENTQNIILCPYAEIPLKEKWLFDNKEAIRSVKEGLSQSKKKQLIDRGSFKNHIKE